MRNINLENLWDSSRLCRCPHKGWYLHYFDNGLHRYGAALEPGDFLEDFPGLNHIYLRLAWCYLEPREGEFTWQVVDDVIGPWTARGYSVAFRITCKETEAQQRFATPQWVRDAGAQGTFLPARKPDGSVIEQGSWEPDFGDPVFLEKLDTFHRVFAERYDHQPWMEYVDIGSYGSWGEGHNFKGSQRDWPTEVIKRHIDIHRAHYRTTPILLNDDFVGSRVVEDGSREEILRYAVEQGLGMRDDSVCVKVFADAFGASTLRNPEFFEHAWRTRPVDMELEHYASAVRSGTYRGGVPLTKAVDESHATFVGFHGDARQWLRENPDLAVSLGNRAGYWYFLKSMEIPDAIRVGEDARIKLRWENHGVAPAYRRYRLTYRLSGAGGNFEQALPESDNRRWMPGSIVEETVTLRPPGDIPAGEYSLGIRLHEERADRRVPVAIAFREELRDADGFYAVASVKVV